VNKERITDIKNIEIIGVIRGSMYPKVRLSLSLLWRTSFPYINSNEVKHLTREVNICLYQ